MNFQYSFYMFFSSFFSIFYHYILCKQNILKPFGWLTSCENNVKIQLKLQEKKIRETFFGVCVQSVCCVVVLCACNMISWLIHITGQQSDLIKVECIWEVFSNDRPKKQTSIQIHRTLNIETSNNEQRAWPSQPFPVCKTKEWERRKEKNYYSNLGFHKLQIVGVSTSAYLTSLFCGDVYSTTSSTAWIIENNLRWIMWFMGFVAAKTSPTLTHISVISSSCNITKTRIVFASTDSDWPQKLYVQISAENKNRKIDYTIIHYEWLISSSKMNWIRFYVLI